MAEEEAAVLDALLELVVVVALVGKSLKVEKKLNMENKEKAVAVSEKMIGMAIAFCVV